MLSTLAIANYRSLRALVVPLGRLNLVTGANGSGKSNLYRALRLLVEARGQPASRFVAGLGKVDRASSATQPAFGGIARFAPDSALETVNDYNVIALEKDLSQTRVVGQG